MSSAANEDRNVQAVQQGWAETPEASVALEGGSASAGAAPPSSAATALSRAETIRDALDLVAAEKPWTTQDARDALDALLTENEWLHRALERIAAGDLDASQIAHEVLAAIRAEAFRV